MILDMRPVCTYTDFFVLCTGRNPRQTKAIYDEVVVAPAEPVERAVDTTGAGDLLAAAYIWADLHSAELVDRLRWSVLYASLGASKPTGVGGAATEAELLEAGIERGLQPPPDAAAD